MHSYNHRSVKAISEYRYSQINKNHRNHGRIGSNQMWRGQIWQDEVWPSQPIRRKQRANNRAPNRSRAA